jgi:hypothetical protein
VFLWLADYRDLFDEALLALIGINVVSSLMLILLRFLIGSVGFHYGLTRGSHSKDKEFWGFRL